MVNVVTQSLPYLPDRAAIHKALEDCKGNIDHAVSNLLDAEERGSVSSTQASSSVEREHDSDEEDLSGPNKKQDRRLSRATRLVNKEKEDKRRRELPVRAKKYQDQATATRPQSLPSECLVNGLKTEVEENEEDDDEAWQDDPTHRDTESASISASEHNTVDKPPSSGVRLKLSQPKRGNNKDPPLPPNSAKSRGTASECSSHGRRTQPRFSAPNPKRVTQRDKRDLKKAAQKAAAKERKQGMAVGKTANGKNGAMVIASKGGKENSPAIESVIKTLYI